MVSNSIPEGGGRGKPRRATTKKRTGTEKQRRKRMQNMFSNLHSLLPKSLDQRVDKSTIVDEAIKYIKTLETTLESLQENKQQTLNKPTQVLDLSLAINKPQIQTVPPTPLSCPASNGFKTFVSNNVVMSVVGDDAQISMYYIQDHHRKPGLYVKLASVLDKFKLDFVTGRISAIGHLTTFMIHARASRCCNNSSGEGIKATEDVFKVAAEEISFLLA